MHRVLFCSANCAVARMRAAFSLCPAVAKFERRAISEGRRPSSPIKAARNLDCQHTQLQSRAPESFCVRLEKGGCSPGGSITALAVIMPPPPRRGSRRLRARRRRHGKLPVGFAAVTAVIRRKQCDGPRRRPAVVWIFEGRKERGERG